jgi:transcriptional regulator with AAA-type ATPase domain
MARQRISAPELLRRSELPITLPTLRNRLSGKSPFFYEELVQITRALGVGFSAFQERTEVRK